MIDTDALRTELARMEAERAWTVIHSDQFGRYEWYFVESLDRRIARLRALLRARQEDRNAPET